MLYYVMVIFFLVTADGKTPASPPQVAISDVSFKSVEACKKEMSKINTKFIDGLKKQIGDKKIKSTVDCATMEQVKGVAAMIAQMTGRSRGPAPSVKPENNKDNKDDNNKI